MAENALIAVEALNPLVVYGQGGIEDVLAKLKREASLAVQDVDVSTKPGRDLIASTAYRVARSKTALDDMGKELVAGLKEQAGKVDAERRRVRDECDRLRDEIRKPLDEFEDMEKRRVAGHEAAILALSATATVESLANLSSIDIAERLALLGTLADDGRDWQEFRDRARKSALEAHTRLGQLLDIAKMQEAAAVQAVREREEQAAQRQRDHDAQIAAEATDRARREASEAAERASKLAAKEMAESEAKFEREKAKRVADAKAATEKLAREKEAAAQRERERISAEQAKERAAAERREANERNRRRVRAEVVKSLVAAGYLDNLAERLFDDIADGKIARLSVTW